MSSSLTYKCPSCGAYLEYDPASAKYSCPYCHSFFDENTLSPEESESSYAEYHCQNCGAQVVCGETTAATRCYFCHSPVILTDRLTSQFKPDGVIPFSVSKDAASQAFDKFIGKKKFVKKSFFTDEQRESISGVYYPFWVGDFDGVVSFDGVGTRVSSLPSGDYIYTTTKYYNVHRAGNVTFRRMVRKALSKNESKLTDGIQPFSFADMKQFSPGFLSGFSAEIRDVEEKNVRQDMEESVRKKSDSMVRQGASFSSLNGKSSYTTISSSMKYVLLPTWIITYPGSEPDKPFYFMMNGQTGNVRGKLPVDWGKLSLVCLAVFLIVFLLLTLGGMFIW